MYDDEDDLLLQDENGHVDSAIDGDWEVMRKSGVNGWVSIVGWDCAFGTGWFQRWVQTVIKRKQQQNEHREDWLSAVKDVSFVLTKAMDYST